MRPGSRLALLLLSQRSAHSSNLLCGLQSQVYGAKDAIGLLHSELPLAQYQRRAFLLLQDSPVPRATPAFARMQQELRKQSPY